MKQMKIICMGDSLTEGDYGIPGVRGTPNVKKENYPYFLSLLTGGEVKNYGKCGFRASQYLDLYHTGKFNVEGADIIIMMLGTNGGFDDKIDTPDNEAFCSLLDLLANDVPSAKIVLCTPPHATSNEHYVNHGYMPQILLARSFIRRVADDRKLPVIEVANCPDFCEENEHIMQPNDGLHFGLLGYQTLAKFIYEELKSHKLI